MTADRPNSAHEGNYDSASLDRALQALRRGQPVPPDIDLTDADSKLVDGLGPWLSDLEAAAQSNMEEDQSATAANTPVRHDDPIALMLGLVPTPDVALDGRRLASARRNAKIDLAEFRRRLNGRGWSVSLQEAFQWEQNFTALAPALIDAIADELRVDRETLLKPSRPQSSEDLFDDARIRAYLSAWADDVGVPADLIRDRTSRMLATAAFRNKSSGSVDDLLTVLRTLREIPNLLDHDEP